MNKKFQIFDLKNIHSDKSMLTPLELKEFIDFEIKRIYFITNAKEQTSQHCHFEEKELFIIVQGSCTAVIDKGSGTEEVELTGPKKAIYVPNYVWHGFKNLSSDLIICALSSTNYNPDRSDYIEDYNEYLKIRD